MINGGILFNFSLSDVYCIKLLRSLIRLIIMYLELIYNGNYFDSVAYSMLECSIKIQLYFPYL